MNTCDTCKWWGGKAGGLTLPFLGPDLRTHWVEMYGVCGCEKLQIGVHREIDNEETKRINTPIKTDGLSSKDFDGHGSDWVFTGPKFGCIHHEAK